MEINKDYLNYLSHIIYSYCGINIQEKKYEFLENRLYRRLKSYNFTGIEEYCEYIKRDSSGCELKELVNAVCTNTTEFFRGIPHFEFLNEYFKKLFRVKVDNIHIWSAACSSGEEPYSIAMLAAENLLNFKSIDFKILASDIDSGALTEAITGVYNKSKISKINNKLLQKYFVQDGNDNFRINEYIRKYIFFRQLNLIDTSPFDAKFDIIFCRNVLIYFDTDTRERVINNLCSRMKPTGFLFIGHTESLINLDLKFKLKYIQPSVYQIQGEN